MRMFNADGSESEMCGNGIRCVAKYVYDHGIATRDQLRIETGAGILSLKVHTKNGLADQITVDMGEPRLESSLIPTTLAPVGQQVVNVPIEIKGRKLFATCVSMGNPHCVIFVPEIDDELVLGIGPLIEKDDRFPKKVNVEFVEVLARGEVNQRTWERGSGENVGLWNGSKCRLRRRRFNGPNDRTIVNNLIGGQLRLTWDESTNHVMMTGPATKSSPDVGRFNRNGTHLASVRSETSRNLFGR